MERNFIGLFSHFLRMEFELQNNLLVDTGSSLQLKQLVPERAYYLAASINLLHFQTDPNCRSMRVCAANRPHRLQSYQKVEQFRLSGVQILCQAMSSNRYILGGKCIDTKNMDLEDEKIKSGQSNWCTMRR